MGAAKVVAGWKDIVPTGSNPSGDKEYIMTYKAVCVRLLMLLLRRGIQGLPGDGVLWWVVSCLNKRGYLKSLFWDTQAPQSS